jgi:hypothetical protein
MNKQIIFEGRGYIFYISLRSSNSLLVNKKKKHFGATTMTNRNSEFGL